METETTTLSLKDKLNTDMKAAMLAKDNRKRDAIRVLKAEISREEAGLKTYGDEEVIRLIRKSIKNLEVMGTDEAKEEIKILESYVPTLLSENDIKTHLQALIAENNYTSLKDMGRVMNAFNEKYKGQADGKLLSTIVKTFLS